MSELSNMVTDYFKKKNLDINEISTQIDNLKIDVIRQYLGEDDGKKYVIKRGGTIEPYNSEKIMRSIKNAADSHNKTLNTSDLRIIMDDVKKYMNKLDRTVFKTDEIKEFVKEALINEGYSQIYDSYVSYIEI